MLEFYARSIMWFFKEWVEVLWEYFVPYYLVFVGLLLLSFLWYWVVRKKALYFIYFFSLNQNTITMWLHLWFAQRFSLLTHMVMVLQAVRTYNFILAHNRAQLFVKEEDLAEYDPRVFIEFDDIGTTGEDLKQEEETSEKAQYTLKQLREDTKDDYEDRLKHEKEDDHLEWLDYLTADENTSFWEAYKFHLARPLKKVELMAVDLLWVGTQELRFYFNGKSDENAQIVSLFSNLFKFDDNSADETESKWDTSELARLSDITLFAEPNIFYNRWSKFGAQYHPLHIIPVVNNFDDEEFIFSWEGCKEHCIEHYPPKTSKMISEDKYYWFCTESYKSRRLPEGFDIGASYDYEIVEQWHGTWGQIKCRAVAWFWEPNYFNIDDEDGWWDYLKRLRADPYSLFNYLDEPGFIDFDWVQRICRFLFLARWLYLIRPIREHFFNDVVIGEPKQLQSISSTCETAPSTKIVEEALDRSLDRVLLRWGINPEEWFDYMENIIVREETELFDATEANREKEKKLLEKQEEEVRKIVEQILS